MSNQHLGQAPHLLPLFPQGLHRRVLHPAEGSMMPTWKKPSSVSQRWKRMSVRGWKPRVSAQRSLPWPLLLHVSLLLPQKVLSAVDLRGSGAMIPDACALTAADEQLLQALRPAAERAVRQAAPRMGPAATQRFSRSIRNAPGAAQVCSTSDGARSAVDCFSAPHQSWRRNYEADHTAVDCFALARFMLETKRRDGSICGRPLFVAPSTAAGCHRSATVGEAKVPPTISYGG